MFDELEKKENPSPGEDRLEEQNQGPKFTSESEMTKEVEDIFFDENDEPENAFYNEGKEKPPVFEPIKEKNKQNKEEYQVLEEASSPFKKILVVFLIFISLFVVASGLYFSYNRYFKNTIFNNEITETEDKEELLDTKETNNIKQNQVEPIIETENMKKDTQESEELDSDGDGLGDKQELELGLNIYNIDTDGDGLFDREEVFVYKTDPKNKDSDGDTYLDGAEVSAGYNPLGEGKLYDINQEINGQ